MLSAKKRELDRTISYLKSKKRVLLILTSNRKKGFFENSKSEIIAKEIKNKLGSICTIIDATKLKIYPCEGNVSHASGNICGIAAAQLRDKTKNPSGYHRCWASIHHSDDELWKISKDIFNSDAVIFLGSVRWGQMNSIYQMVIERLTWIENRKNTLNEGNIVGKIDMGLICIGHNWRANDVVKIQREVLASFGFKTPKELFWGWQYTNDGYDESLKSYKNAFPRFKKDFGL
jgi:multimeric flavodoxin WrbA